ncbi:hypothetical protein A1O7_00323 [Cladophialophora yegresii CBS 114405]|uniref:Uncharacterized protein n=1 Tax=Cladophialophora yegresii CBS 114405 TaxID=1182544 RepID=W9W7Q3_9EURO|nr:uncharacterized protein A1O7_00323 [Cladophialophora yegresii CBS 114405]EXJ63988.1 hypothetical protein A1O7_00323 [Cladophialophora yegresii CBS 114405]
MRLRSSITTPTRLEDEEPVTPNNRNGTKPAHPGLMKAKATPFNPNNPPAAFPSLPLTSMAMSVENKPVSEATTTGDNETENSLPDQGSLAGITSDIHGQEDSQIQTSQIGVKVEQDDTQQDQTHEEVTQKDGSADDVVARATANQDSATTATSSTTTQTVSNNDQTAERDSNPSQQTLSSGAAHGIENQNAAATTMSTTNDSRAVRRVNWNELSLSMQYHIYKALKEYPVHPRHIIRLLGMNPSQFAQIEHAVSLRALHPASLVDLWAFCASISIPIPGIQPGMDGYQIIDPDVFKEYAAYFTFTCKYDCAFDGEVRLARRFLMDHNLSLAFMGQWELDPYGSAFLQFVPHVPSTRMTPLARASNVPRPLSDPVQNPALLPVRGRPGLINPVRPSQRAVTARNALRHPALRGQPVLPSDPAAAQHARELVDQRTQPAGRQRHPLAQVSTPGESPTPPQTGQHGAQDIVQPVPTVTRNAASRRTRQSRLRSSGAPSPPDLANVPISSNTNSHQDLPSGSKSKNAPQRTKGSRPQKKANAKRGDVTVQDQSTSSPTSASVRLVLKIDKKDGLAQVVRDAPSKTADATSSTGALKGTAASDVAQNDTVHAPPTVSARALPFSTTMSGFNRGLMMGFPSSSVAAGAADSVFAIPAIRAPANRDANLHHLIKAAPEHPKRKASQSDIRSRASKAPRTKVADTDATPAHGLVAAGIDNTDRLDSEANEAYDFGNYLRDIASAIDHRPLPSPTFSAISENADLPEFQALLEPVKHRLRGKPGEALAFSMVATSEGGDVAVSTPSTPVAELHLLQNIPSPTASGTGESVHDGTSKKSSIPTETSKKPMNKLQKLKLIVGPLSQTPTLRRSGRNSASVRGSSSTMGTGMVGHARTPATLTSTTLEATKEEAVKRRRSARLARKSLVKNEEEN